jgi:hypothetical protein
MSAAKYEMPPTPVDESLQEFPDKKDRPRASQYDARRYQWRFAHIPATIRHNDEIVPNPFLDRALFVVHGIGDQSLTETAAMLREGAEDAIDLIDPGNWESGQPDVWIVPQPYIYDGFWADYHDFERFVPEAYEELSDRQQKFFSVVWNRRVFDPKKTRKWLGEAGRLLLGKSKGLDRLYYLYLVPMLWIVTAFALHWPKSKKLARDYTSDARLYLKPEGDIEHEIVQRIDNNIGGEFLRLLGVDWNLEPLEESDQVWVAGRYHQFKEVVWVAHSLGTVISYNVIGDILQLCLDRRNEGREYLAQPVEDGLRAFVTLGSPLDKIRYIYRPGEVLREWPAEYLPGGEYDLWARHDSAFWQNCHYTSDPVSGALSLFQSPHDSSKPVVENHHTRGLRLPGHSHGQYWRDPEVLKRVLDLLYRPFVKVKQQPDRSQLSQRFGLVTGALFWAVGLLAAVAGIGLLLYMGLRSLASSVGLG